MKTSKKPQITKITLIVDDTQAMQVLRLVDKLCRDVDVSPVETVPFHKNKPRAKPAPAKSHKNKSAHKGHIEAARSMVVNLPKNFTPKEFIAAMAKLNITPTAPHQMLTKLAEEKLIRKIAKGRYGQLSVEGRAH
jgi:hypothetical protein